MKKKIIVSVFLIAALPFIDRMFQKNHFYDDAGWCKAHRQAIAEWLNKCHSWGTDPHSKEMIEQEREYLDNLEDK